MKESGHKECTANGEVPRRRWHEARCELCRSWPEQGSVFQADCGESSGLARGNRGADVVIERDHMERKYSRHADDERRDRHIKIKEDNSGSNVDDGTSYVGWRANVHGEVEPSFKRGHECILVGNSSFALNSRH